MADKAPLYDLVLTGQIAQGVDRSDARVQLAQLFKMSVEKIDGLLNSAPVTLKRDLDWDVAKRYRVAIKQAGAISDIRPAEQSKTPPADSPPETSAAVSATAVQPPGEPANQPPKAAPEWSLAEVGANVLGAEERRPVSSRLDDFQNFSLRPNQGNLLDAAEYTPEIHAPENLGASLDLLPSGSEVLAEHERALPVAALVASPDLEVAQLGERLSIIANKTPPAPDVSHLALSDK